MHKTLIELVQTISAAPFFTSSFLLFTLKPAIFAFWQAVARQLTLCQRKKRKTWEKL
jgi:hypothetical protein